MKISSCREWCVFASGRFTLRKGRILPHQLIDLLATDYGVFITDSSLAGLTARAVVVLDENNKVLHSELVSEIANEPNYDAALAVL